MIKIERTNIDEGWGYDYLYSILQDAFRVLFNSYLIVISKRQKNKYIKKKGTPLENNITDDLIRNTSEISKLFYYRIQKQQEDFETNSKIDIAILYSLKFGDNSNDLKIECKRLDNLKYLVDDGIMSFKTNKYAKKLPLAGMLTYNTSGVISENIKLLNKKIEEKISSSDVLSRFKIIENHQYTYTSSHQRFSNANIVIYTMVFDFKDVIRNSEYMRSV
jgi:hypothetical protein